MFKKNLFVLVSLFMVVGCSDNEKNSASTSPFSPITITYDGNGHSAGTPPTDANLYDLGSTITIAENSGDLENDSLTFIGWNSNAEGTGTLYEVGDTITVSEGSTSMTLYAHWWSQRDLHVSPQGNDSTGTGAPNSPFATLSKAVEQYQNTPTGDPMTIKIANGTYNVTQEAALSLDKSLSIKGGYNDTFTEQTGETILADERTTEAANKILNIFHGSTLEVLAIERITFRSGNDTAPSGNVAYVGLELSTLVASVRNCKFITRGAVGFGFMTGLLNSYSSSYSDQELIISGNYFELENTHGTTSYTHALSNFDTTTDTGAQTFITNNVFNIKSISANSTPDTAAIILGHNSYHANANYIRNNTFLFNGGTAMQTGATPILINSSSLVVQNNLFVNTNPAANTGVATRVHNTGAIDFKNNAYVGFQTLLRANFLDASYNTAQDLNAVGQDTVDNFVSNSVTFTNQANGDYSLVDTPSNFDIAISGLNGGLLNWIETTDFRGVERTASGSTGWSVGAYELDVIQ